MTSNFPNLPDFQGPLAPVRIEASVDNLEVQGSIPKNINGSFIRVQPDPLYPPKLGKDIFFNGDGVISSFQFNQGKVDLVQRYVETARVKAQRESGKSVFGLYRNPYTNDEGYQDRVYSTANTNIVRYQDRLLALKEDNLPYAMDPVTLETFGVDDLDGQFTANTFTAHPKFDPDSGNFQTYSYRANGELTTDVAFFEFNASGKKVNEIWFHAPFPPFIHDFGVTPNYVIFPVIPIKHNEENGKEGGMILQWDYGQDILFGVIRRDGDGSDVQWLHLPNGFPGHVQNVFESAGKLYCDLPVANENVFTFFPDPTGKAPSPDEIFAPLARVELDLEKGTASLSQITELSVEFNKIDERYAGKPYLYGYAIAQDFAKFDTEKMGDPHPFFFNTLTKINVETKECITWCPGSTDSVQEPVFIRRSDDAPEGDGYILLAVNRLMTNSTDLVLLDTAKIEEGPIATIKCPFRLRQGLHGNWVYGVNS